VGVGGGRESSREKKEGAGHSGGSLMVGPGKNMGQHTEKKQLHIA